MGQRAADDSAVARQRGPRMHCLVSMRGNDSKNESRLKSYGRFLHTFISPKNGAGFYPVATQGLRGYAKTISARPRQPRSRTIENWPVRNCHLLLHSALPKRDFCRGSLLFLNGK
jgi:hypothetical protein